MPTLEQILGGTLPDPSVEQLELLFDPKSPLASFLHGSAAFAARENSLWELPPLLLVRPGASVEERTSVERTNRPLLQFCKDVLVALHFKNPRIHDVGPWTLTVRARCVPARHCSEVTRSSTNSRMG